MAALSRTISAWDGLPLHIHDWGTPGHAPALLCLPGLVRTGGDFSELAARYAPLRRVIALDYAGRGASGRARSPERYAPEACLRDITDITAALHLHRVVAIGTSMGGLLAMALAAARPTLLEAVVLNDIGPEIGSAGLAAVRDHVATDPALPNLAECAAHLRAHLPDLSFASAAAWCRFADLTYEQGEDGRFHPRWDTRIASLLGRPAPPLWPLFGALAGIPVLLVHGERSRILTAATVARMRHLRPDMAYVAVPGTGHAPTLGEPNVAAALDQFLAV